MVWLMVFWSMHGSAVTGAIEFTTKERCERAAEQIAKAANEIRWGMGIRPPICVRVEK